MSTVDDETILKVLLDDGPMSMDALSMKTGFGPGRLNGMLCQLHLSGKVTPIRTRVGLRKVTCYALKESAR